MADIYISKIKVRRGTNAEINSTRFDQGELVHATDSKRLFIGNGVLSGGNPVSSKVHPPLNNYYSLSTTLAEVGDLVSVNSIWYQLTASPYSSATNWGDVRTKFSSEFIYDSTSTVNMAVSGLSASKINPNTVTNGVNIIDGKIQLNYRTNFFEISSNQLSIKTGGITTREILSSSFANGLSGGNGNIISLTVDPDIFYFDSGILKVDFPTISGSQSHLPVSVLNDLSALPAKVGDISSFNEVIYQLRANPATTLENWGQISLGDDNNTEYLSIYDALTGQSTLNSTNSLSSIFNGNPSQTINGGVPGVTITRFEAVSSNGISNVTLTLSSAGFITFDENYTTETGKTVGRFAIPIFAY
jgi:hypothetical protein